MWRGELRTRRLPGLGCCLEGSHEEEGKMQTPHRDKRKGMWEGRDLGREHMEHEITEHQTESVLFWMLFGPSIGRKLILHL